MKIIDTNRKDRVNVESVPEGVVFKHNGMYYMKIVNVFTYADVDDYLDEYILHEIGELEQYADFYNAILLSSGGFYYIDEDTFVEPLKTELHIV